MQKILFRWIAGLAVGLFILYLLFTNFSEQPGIPPKSERKDVSEVRLRYFDGKGEWSLADHRGKVVLINYWATWCPPCRYEMPTLVRISQTYKDKPFEIVGVTVDEDLSQIPSFVERYSIPYPILIKDLDPNVGAFLSLPTTFLYDKQGRLAKRYVGVVRESTLHADISTLLNE
ncbi:MAG: TlpA family protein disulfide reductase [Pyrinomonadaceae bacterium]|nr:TlpA family protein disulfide reductase [Pyrinomonadaceae bacterium]MCX7638977.1 TlpA family protein disulfide reductase [Pyrinomonadaceae bacterium]MDW8303804.1 TlpA disulfide reductase family protein [Acidobacteriota bacterium]